VYFKQLYYEKGKKVKVSKAQKSDIPEIIRFNINMAMETENKKLDRQTVTKGVQEVFNSPSLGYYIIVKDSSGILGCLMITYEWSDWRNGLFWWIQSVYVKKEYRRKGVFRKMYKFINERAIADKKCTGIRLYVENNNSIAQKVYNNLGMTETYYKLFEVDFNE
tara:strand:+ start:143 stop:634 length:492 start_codon:yes stop_codon:yes gene_type:complete